MARKKRSMRTIQRVLQLRVEHGLTIREIARSTGLPASTVGDYLQEAEAAGLSWPLPEGLTEQELHQRLRGNPTPVKAAPARRPEPDWSKVHRELGRKGVTLRLLWEEYHREHPEGYRYSRFCERYGQWRRRLDPVLRRPHEPGKAMYVDWAGATVPIVDAETGEVHRASVFVAVLGYSHYLYAEAFLDQKLGSWITGHIHAYEFMNGASELTIPDNPKTAVVRADRYEPRLHPTYQELGEHYGTVILPARARKPRDKAKAETGVQIAQRRILAALRDHTFFSLGALNAVIREKLAELNQAPFQRQAGSRRERWLEERERLGPLPPEPYELARWSTAKVNIDYHVAVDHHFYSVPYQHVGAEVEVRLSEQTVEIYRDGRRIAAHPRSFLRGGFTTVADHRPKSHQAHLEWTPGRMVDWARTVGPATGELVARILQNKPHPEQGYRSCLGVIRLAKAVGAERMEKAARRALHFDLCSYSQLKSILENRLEQEELEPALSPSAPSHPNLRGAEYYQ